MSGYSKESAVRVRRVGGIAFLVWSRWVSKLFFRVTGLSIVAPSSSRSRFLLPVPFAVLAWRVGGITDICFRLQRGPDPCHRRVRSTRCDRYLNRS